MPYTNNVIETAHLLLGRKNVKINDICTFT